MELNKSKKKIKEENLNKIKHNNMQGITLIALVVTIIILIILAGVSINLVLGDNGIITKAKYAKEQQEMAQIKEKLEMAIIEIESEEITSGRETTIDTLLEKLPIKLPGITVSKEGNTLKGTYEGYDFTIDENFKVTIDGYNPSTGGNNTPTAYTITFNGTNVTSNGESTINEKETYNATLTPTTGYGIASITITMGDKTLVENTDYTYTDGAIEIPNVNGNLTITVTTLQTVASKRTSELTYFNEKTTLIDSNGNIVKVPEGFKIAEDSGINVTEGIVIEDNDIIEGIGNNRGNQYVWIPVGIGIKKADGTTKNITLGRYVFADGENDMAEDEVTPLDKGTPILVQNINDYTNQTDAIKIDTFYEDITQRPGVASDGLDGLNATALSIANFKKSVEDNGGYYIARYEASYGTDKKANSKVSTGTPATSDGSSYAPTTEGALWNNITQMDAATASRGLYTTATTDLINSYAWDTAIVYIQEFSENTDYSRQVGKSINASLVNTGENRDEVCKINDMASNTCEWTTEFSEKFYSSTTFASSSWPCVSRGGCYNWTTNYTSYRNIYDYATIRYANYTFRCALYM